MIFGAKTPKIFYWLFPSLIWKMKASDKKIWLTFDDGPTTEATPFILDTLRKYNITATFFCLGKNMENNPEILRRVKKDGHSIGNHSYSHPNGFLTCTKTYIADIEKCKEILPGCNLFRPPYGKITPKQIRRFKTNFKIIMWDVLAWDFNKNTSVKKCIDNVVNNVESGSIIVLHDSKETSVKIKQTLPKILERLKKNGYTFSSTW